MGSVEVALIFALRIARDRHHEWPMILMAVLSAALLAAGVLRHYWDIYVHRTVRGISFIFVGIDAAGDLFSLISVIFQPALDILGMVIYGTELLLWIGVFVCGGYFNFTPWLKKKIGEYTNHKKNVHVHARRNPSGVLDSESEQRARDMAHHLESEPNADADADAVRLQNLPSSTSVFRTPSSELAARSRANFTVHPE